MTDQEAHVQFIKKLAPTFKKFWKGKLVEPTETRHCGNCGGGSFSYNSGMEWSECGMRGYRCNNCGCVKPERLNPLFAKPAKTKKSP